MMKLLSALLLFLTVASCSLRSYKSLEMEKDLPKFGTFGDTEKVHSPLIRLVDPKTLQGYCSATVIDDQYALTAAHCVLDNEGWDMSKNDILIWSENNKNTHILARAVACNKREDYAVIKGDFRTFAKLQIADNNILYKYGQDPNVRFLSCGFPHGGTASYCSELTRVHAFEFHIRGYGALYPGMSGGPTVALNPADGKVYLVGINVAVSIGEPGVHIVPYVHLLETFGLIGGQE